MLLLQARPKRVAIQVKALDKYILMVLFVLLLQTRPKRVTIQVKALEEYILMVLFVLLLKRVHFLTNKTQIVFCFIDRNLQVWLTRIFLEQWTNELQHVRHGHKHSSVFPL